MCVKNKLACRLMAIWMIVGANGLVNASLITYRFEGKTQGVLLTPPGSDFVLDLVLDPSVADGCGSPTYGCYEDGGVVSYSLFYGSDLVTSPILGPSTLGAQLTVYDNLAGNDQFRFAAIMPAQLGFSSLEVNIDLWDSTQTAFSDDSFPTNLRLNAFDRANLTLSGFPEGEVGNVASVSPITSLSTVPSPATFALFAIGLAGLRWSRRKNV